MRTLITWSLILAVAGPVAQSARGQATTPGPRRGATPAASKPATPPDPAAEKVRLEQEAKARAEMDRVLEKWEEKSKKVTSLDVQFDRVDRSVGWGDQYYRGRAMLQSPDHACLEFQKYKLDANGKPAYSASKDDRPVPQLEPQPTERIVCTGSEVLQYSYEDRKVFIYPLDKESRQKALQQGPLPFLFNMKAADARLRYTMILLKQDEKNFLIQILPKEKVDRESFSQAFLWLSKETYLPNQLYLYTVGEKEKQEFQFAGNSNTIQANAPMDGKMFSYRAIDGWKEVRNPGGNDAASPAGPLRRAASPAPAKASVKPR